MRLRHLARLLCEVIASGVINRQPWLTAFIVALFLLASVVVVGQTAVPFLYTLF